MNVCKAPPGPPPGLQCPPPEHPGSTAPAPAHNGNLPPAPAPTPGQRQSLHLMHWDLAHPTGQPIPLRQPNPPVYYNVPAPPEGSCQSGSQSPASLSCSDLSEDSGTTQDSVCYPGWERCCPQQQQFPGPAQFQQQCCQQWQQTYQPCHYPSHPAFPTSLAHNVASYPTNQNNYPPPQAHIY